MKKNLYHFICCALVTIVVSACKKDKAVTPAAIVPLKTLGLYQYASGTNKRVFIPITKVGTQTVSYYGIFDTGSTGLTLDADGILPASMITSSGFVFSGDSININGITVTSKQAVISYGDLTNTVKEYGNLAYAPVTIGDANGNITTKRIPFFLYYKVVNSTTGVQYAAHSSDVFGVGPGTSYANSAIASPLSYFDLSTGVTSGFRLAMLNSANFTSTGPYVGSLLSIGLTPADLATLGGFILHPLTYANTGGYSPNISATITYSGKSVAAQVLFDTGTPSISVIENKLETNGLGSLPANSAVTITTNKGFVYSYTTTSTSNLTAIQNPNISGDYRTIFSIDFFTKNEYLTDYTNHRIGLKNN
ncbi:MAG: hypothetical protein EOP42_28830 [Sphingobacteriaceae bacterium]|nr:MAG: hypothetical protein EOP42_28830 [Sphingobacteriaceae bacterium]